MRNAIVTGGSRGIGLSIAQSLLNAGYNVAIVGRSQSNLDAAVKQLSGTGREA
ncbi:MAG: SDR family NAD(P)-dependent oxidoreductase, partial [Pseudomonadales bacterium]